MAAITFEPVQDGGFRVAGRLGFDTVHEVWETSRAALGGASQPRLDLGDVSYVDSAGLALVLEWAAWARAAGGQVLLQRVPDKLRDLARISEVDALLGLAGGQTAAGAQGASSVSSSNSSSG